MKTLQNRLAAVTCAALFGCGSNLHDLETEVMPIEETTIEVSGAYMEDEECFSADVIFSQDNYIIICDNEHSFVHQRTGIDSLRWGDDIYHDNTGNGDVDAITKIRDGTQVYSWTNNNDINRAYDRLVTALKKDYVQKVWERRWQR